MNTAIQAVERSLWDAGQRGLRVGGTRVLLEHIVHAFKDGAIPGGIVERYHTMLSRMNERIGPCFCRCSRLGSIIGFNGRSLTRLAGDRYAQRQSVGWS